MPLVILGGSGRRHVEHCSCDGARSSVARSVQSHLVVTQGRLAEGDVAAPRYGGAELPWEGVVELVVAALVHGTRRAGRQQEGQLVLRAAR